MRRICVMTQYTEGHGVVKAMALTTAQIKELAAAVDTATWRLCLVPLLLPRRRSWRSVKRAISLAVYCPGLGQQAREGDARCARDNP